MKIRLHMWEYRDGSIHPEIRIVSFFHDIEGSKQQVLLSHIDGGDRRNITACGLRVRGSSSTGLGNPSRINCEECRAHLKGRTLDIELDDPIVEAA